MDARISNKFTATIICVIFGLGDHQYTTFFGLGDRCIGTMQGAVLTYKIRELTKTVYIVILVHFDTTRTLVVLQHWASSSTWCLLESCLLQFSCSVAFKQHSSLISQLSKHFNPFFFSCATDSCRCVNNSTVAVYICCCWVECEETTSARDECVPLFFMVESLNLEEYYLLVAVPSNSLRTKTPLYLYVNHQV